MPIKLGSTTVIPKGFKAVYWGTKLVYGGSVEPWETVSGIAPLTLPNALARPMKGLTQHGKVAVSGSTITCNNGTLTPVDDELPVEYKRITSITFDGDFWYDTDETMLGSDNVTMTLANTSNTGQNVFGSYNGTSSGTKNFSFYLYGNGSSTGSYLRYGSQLVRPKFGSGERTISFGANGTSGFSTDSTVTPDTFETVATAYIGMLPNSTSPAYTGSIIGNILVGTRLKYIPCERQSDGAVGYYEAVNGKFIEKSGTGTPVKGSYDTSHETAVSVVGTPEEILVGQKENLITGWTEGYYIAANGTPTAETDSHYTDLIPVEQDREYVLSFVAAVDNNKRMHEYDSNGNWLRQCFFYKPSVNENVSIEFSVGSNTKYIRWSTKVADTNVTIVEDTRFTRTRGRYIDSDGVEKFGNGAYYTSAYAVDSDETYYLDSTQIASGANNIRVHGYTSESLDSWYGLLYIVEISGSNKTDYHQLEIPQNVKYIRLSGNIAVSSELLPLPVPQGTTSATAVNLYACGGSEDTQDIITGEVIRRNNVIVYDGTQEIGERYVGEKEVGNVIVYPKEIVQTGEVVTFNHSRVEPLNELKVEFMATQEGTGDPSPTNVRPIVGVTEINAYLESAYNASATPKISVVLPPQGKNLWDESKLTAQKIESGGGIVNDNNYRLSGYIPVEVGSVYRFSRDNGTGAAFYYTSYNDKKEYIKGPTQKNGAQATDTIGSDVAYIRVHVLSVYNKKAQLEKGTSITSYEPFIPQMGGYANLMKGNGIGRLGYMTFDGSENWQLDQQYNVFFLDNNSVAKMPSDEMGVLLCDRLKPITYDDRNTYSSPRIYVFYNFNRILVRGIDGVTTVEELKAWLAENPVTCAYVLATPKSFDIPQSQLQLRSGQNAIWSDEGQVTAYVPAEPTIEHVTPQPISTVEGDNTVSVTANVSDIAFDAEYAVNQ